MKRAFIILLVTGTLSAVQNFGNQATHKPWEKFLGAWKMVPGPDDPTTPTLKVEPEGGGVKIGFDCKKDGSCPDIIIVSYDGKPYKNAGYPSWEASFRKTGNQTMEEDGYSSGKPSTKVAWQLSPDGKTLKRTYHDIDHPGSKDNTLVYDRSGGPASKDDAFIGFWKHDWNKSDAAVVTYTRTGDVFTFTGTRGVVRNRNCDGNDHPDSASIITGDLYSCRFLDDRTYEESSKRSGKVASTMTSKISEDGKKLVRDRRNAEGKTTFKATYEKIE